MSEEIYNRLGGDEADNLLDETNIHINDNYTNDKKKYVKEESFNSKLLKYTFGIVCLVFVYLIVKQVTTSNTDNFKEFENERDNPIKISIIIPAYNSAKYLPRSIDIALNQTLKDIEVIVVNDASTDNTTDVLRNYEKDPRMIIVNKGKNGGASPARNSGLDIASGEFIGFIDSDDYCDKNYFENLYSYSEGYDVIEGMFLSCTDLSDKCLHHKKYNPHGSIYDSIWRRSFLNKYHVRFGEKKTGEDIDFRNDCYKHKPRIYETPDVGIYYYYKRRAGSLMNFPQGYLEKINKEAIEQEEKEKEIKEQKIKEKEENEKKKKEENK